MVVAWIREILTGISKSQDKYYGRSFRIGAVISIALAGIEDLTNQTLGRWHSAAFLRYTLYKAAERIIGCNIQEDISFNGVGLVCILKECLHHLVSCYVYVDYSFA